MKNVKVIFAKRHNFATSCEEITGENFQSQYSEDPNRFTVYTGEVSDENAADLMAKAGNPNYRVKLINTADTHTGDIDGKPTVNYHISNGKLLKKAV